jgi:hypothetical protein
MPAKKLPPKKKSARVKKAVAKKQVCPPEKVKITVDLGPLGPLETSPDQILRLKTYLENQVLTWLKLDLGSESAPPIQAHEFMFPPNQPPGEGDGTT